MKLIIKQSSWSGWTKDYKPIEVENEYEIKLNEKYIIKTTKISHLKDDRRRKRSIVFQYFGG